jgi:hypothetical protein
MNFDWLALSPVLLCATMAVIVLLADAFARTRIWSAMTVLSAATVIGAGVLTGVLDGQRRATMCSTTTTADAGADLERCSFAVDELTVAVWWILLAAALLVVLMATASASDAAMPPGEFHSSARIGHRALSLAASRDLVSRWCRSSLCPCRRSPWWRCGARTGRPPARDGRSSSPR